MLAKCGACNDDILSFLHVMSSYSYALVGCGPTKCVSKDKGQGIQERPISSHALKFSDVNGVGGRWGALQTRD